MDFDLLPLRPEEFPATCEALDAGVAEGVAPGFVAGIWRRSGPGEFLVRASGQRRLSPSPQPLSVDTVFDLASVTKVFSTATLAAVLVDRGWIRWDLPVKALIPEYVHRDIELRHLLSHTAGLPGWKPLWQTLRERFAGRDLARISVEDRQRAMRELVVNTAPEAAPDHQAVYSDISFLMLGFALEEAVNMPLDRAVKTLVWDPMGIEGAYYRRVTRSAGEQRDERVAATELCPWRGAMLQGQVHDDNCWAMGGYAGHAGAFGRAEDVLRFAARLMSGFLTPATLDAAWTRVSKPVGCTRTLGWDTPSGPEPSVGKSFSIHTVGHLGFTGTSLWIDRDAGLAVTLLSNRVHPTRDNIQIRAFRPRFHEALKRDLALRDD